MLVGFKSDKGRIRSNNEDACFVLQSDKVYVVADGVGGGNAGEIASRMAVSEIANYVVNNPINMMKDTYDIVSYLQDCINNANKKIFNMSHTHEENSGMATTTVLVYARDGKAYITNVGDSRVYLYRENQLVQLTEGPYLC